MDRKSIKKEARGVLKRNYLKCILVAFIVMIVVNLGYNYTSKIEQNETINNNKTNYAEKVSNYDTMERFFKDIGMDITIKDDKNAKGIAAPIVNKISEKKSTIICFLNSIDLAFFKNNINGAVVSLSATLVLLLIYIFVQNIITIGSCRFFLEIRRYNKTKIDKLLYPYKSKKILNLAYITFMKELYLFLWLFTIVGEFIKYYEYSMIPYVLAENPKIKKKDAFRISKELTRGYKWELFKLDISMIGWVVLAIFTFNLSNIFYTNAYRKTIYAEFYMKTRNENKDKFKSFLIDNNLEIENPKDECYPELIKESKDKKDKTKLDYDKNYSLTTYILFFFTFAFIGWAYEVGIHLVTDGVFVNRGTMLGPWLPIYGFGGVFILFLLKPFRKNYVLFFISSIVLAGILEYFTSWYLEIHYHTKWWDYSNYFLNLNGRICFEGLLVFGLGGCAMTYFIAPMLDNLYNKIKPKLKIIICMVLLICYGADFAYSSQHPNTGKGITDYENHEK